jgi:outer membrane lipoprotein carrier protein
MRTAVAAVVLALVLGRGLPVTPAVALAEPTLDEVIGHIEETYAKLTDLKAAFGQTAFNKSLNQSIPAEGTVYLKKGGKMRWEYSAPSPQQIVSDGKSIWIYTPELNQVNVGEAPKALAGPAGSFLAGLGRLREHFHVRFLNPTQKKNAEGHFVLDLTPKQPEPALSRLIVAVDPRDWLVRKAEVFDQLENSVTMRFTQVTINAGLPDALFAFVPPKGAATVPMGKP